MPEYLWILDSGEVTPLARQDAAPMTCLRPAYDGQAFDDFGLISNVSEAPSVSLHRITLRDATLSLLPGTQGMVVTQDGRVVGETTFNTDEKARDAVVGRRDQAVRLDLPLLHFTDAWVTNYCHWLCHSLGKVLLAEPGLPPDLFAVQPEFSRMRDGRKVGYSDEVWTQTLARFAPPRPRMSLGPGLYRTPELHLLWTNFGSPEHLWLLKSFHAPFQAAAAEVRGGPQRKLLVLRRDDPRMSQSDLEALQGVARRFDYTPVHLEDADFEHQLKLFANATHVAGPHGAALGNLVFCRPGTRVLELNKDLDGLGYLRPWFYLLAEGAGHEYRYLNRFKGDLTEPRLEEAFSRMEA